MGLILRSHFRRPSFEQYNGAAFITNWSRHHKSPGIRQWCDHIHIEMTSGLVGEQLLRAFGDMPTVFGGNLYRHEGPAIFIKKFLTFRTPVGKPTAVDRNQPLPRSRRERAHINLKASALVGFVSEIMPGRVDLRT